MLRTVYFNQQQLFHFSSHESGLLRSLFGFEVTSIKMQPIHFNYSLKSIPVPNRLQYQKMLVSKGESFIKRLRWKLFAIQNPSLIKSKLTYGFQTTTPPPSLKQLKAFEDDFFKLIQNVTFRPVKNEFQTKLRNDIKIIQNTPEIIVSADKSRNIYKIKVDEYNKLLHNNITTNYKKAKTNELTKTNGHTAEIAKSLELDDRMDRYIEVNAYVTIKDHKPNFPSKVECRLINPAKSNLGKVSKIILEKIARKIGSVRGSNQWSNSSQVIEWFINLKNKNKLTFVNFDIVSFYPSINKDIFEKTLTWAKQYCVITDDEMEILRNSRESLLNLNQTIRYWSI